MENLGSSNGFCFQTAGIWQMLGKILIMVKIILPIILIVMGVIYLGKAVISKDEKDIKKNVSSLLKKFLVAIIIFFIPQIVTVCFNFVSGFSSVKEDFNVCQKCISNPKSVECEANVLKNE